MAGSCTLLSDGRVVITALHHSNGIQLISPHDTSLVSMTQWRNFRGHSFEPAAVCDSHSDLIFASIESRSFVAFHSDDHAFRSAVTLESSTDSRILSLLSFNHSSTFAAVYTNGTIEIIHYLTENNDVPQLQRGSQLKLPEHMHELGLECQCADMMYSEQNSEALWKIGMVLKDRNGFFSFSIASASIRSGNEWNTLWEAVHLPMEHPKEANVALSMSLSRRSELCVLWNSVTLAVYYPVRIDSSEVFERSDAKRNSLNLSEINQTMNRRKERNNASVKSIDKHSDTPSLKYTEHGSTSGLCMQRRFERVFRRHEKKNEPQLKNGRRNVPKVSSESYGKLISLSDDYIAVGIEGYLSVWDTRYGVGYSFAVLKNSVGNHFVNVVQLIRCQMEDGRETVGVVTENQRDSEAESTVLWFPLELEPLTLSIASSNVNKCLPLMARSCYDVPPLGSHSSIAVAAASMVDGGLRDAFLRKLEESEQKDLEAFRKVINPQATPTVAAVREALSDFLSQGTLHPEQNTKEPVVLQMNGKAHHKELSGNVHMQMNGKQEKKAASIGFLSERVAAATAARSLDALRRGDDTFAALLSEVVRTNRVSASQVYAVFASLYSTNTEQSNSAGESIILPLLSPRRLRVLMAVVRHVRNLSEADTVQVLAFALSQLRSQPETSPVEEERMTRVLYTTLNAPHDASRMVNALRSLAFPSVLLMLQWINAQLVEHIGKLLPTSDLVDGMQTKGKTQQEGNTNSISSELLQNAYFGFSKGEHVRSKTLTSLVLSESKVQHIRLCIEWLEYLMSSHFASMIYSEEARNEILSLYDLVQRARTTFSHLESMRSLVNDIVERLTIVQSKQSKSLKTRNSSSKHSAFRWEVLPMEANNL